MRHKVSFLKRFYDLPINRKQLIALCTSEVISIVGLVGVGAFLIIAGGRRMLVNQAQSELAVTEINYNIKINQMGFGFRGQSDNAAIIAAAKAHAISQRLDSTLQQQVKQILQNEVKAREIEYATLVGKDLRIIVNANADRIGEIFNPSNLVGEVLKNPQQIKTSEIVSWAELAKEKPPLPVGVEGYDALIRYTVTPVRNPQTQEVLGALVSGDIVNDKPPIVHQTVVTLGGGYSAVYSRQPNGEFALATAEQDTNTDKQVQENQGVRYVSLPDTALLSAAVEARGKPVTQRIAVEGQTYTVAARALLNFAGETVAILVRGTPETALNALLRQSLLLQGGIAVLALSVDVLLATLLARAIARPIRHLQQVTQAFSGGNFQARAQVSSADEVGQLAATFNQMADSIVSTWQIEAIAQEQARLNAQLQQEIAERTRTEEALQQSEALLREKNQLLEQTLEKLRSTQAQMVQAEKMSSLGQLVAGIAHEINNPVNFIHGNLTHAHQYTQDLMGLIQLYQQHYLNPPQAIQAEIEAIELDFVIEDLMKLFKSMQVGTERIQEIVLSLRNFSRLDEAEFKAVNIHEGIDSTLMILGNRLKAKPEHSGIEIIKNYGQLPSVECYPGQLNQVFMNLLTNAIDVLEEHNRQRSPQEIKANPGTIRISTEMIEADWIAVYIADNGLGMTEEVRSRIFDSFFTTKPIGKGTGLGLSISYQIVTEKHGGKLYCHSTLGQGTEFVIELPVRQQIHAPHNLMRSVASV
jgi:two-component system, NtrC family, sensor kinase